MRPTVFAAAAALLLALVTMQGGLAQQTKAENTHTPAITDCAQDMGAAVQGGACSQTSLDSPPGLIISHTVLAGACPAADLHVVRYLPAGGSVPLVATYCG